MTKDQGLKEFPNAQNASLGDILGHALDQKKISLSDGRKVYPVDVWNKLSNATQQLLDKILESKMAISEPTMVIHIRALLIEKDVIINAENAFSILKWRIAFLNHAAYMKWVDEGEKNDWFRNPPSQV